MEIRWHFMFKKFLNGIYDILHPKAKPGLVAKKPRLYLLATTPCLATLTFEGLMCDENYYF